MAYTDKNLVITPNVGSAGEDPTITFSGADSTLGAQSLQARIYPTSNGTLSFEGSAGQLFSITNSLTGTIYSVNDVSGIPSIEVFDTGVIRLAQYSGRVLIGNIADNGVDTLQFAQGTSIQFASISANGNITATGNVSALQFSGSGSGLTNLNASNLSSGTVPGDRGVTSGSVSASFVEYNGTTATAGQFDGGTTAPSGTTRLNYGGYFYTTRNYTNSIYNLTGAAGTPTIYPDVTTGSVTLAEGLTTGTLNLGSSTAGAKTVNIGTSTGTTVVYGSTVRLPNAGTPGAGKFLQSDASGNATWQTVVSGGTISNDTTTNSDTFYPGMANNQVSGAWTAAYVSTTKLYFNPSSGTLNATNFNSLSDERLKEDVVEVSNSVDIINKLRGVKYKWKENDNRSYGVIAQEIEKILPELVNGIDVKTVNYSGIVGILINAIKELDQRVKKLENMYEH